MNACQIPRAIALVSILFAARQSALATTFTTIDNPAAAANGQGTVLTGVSGNNVIGAYFDASNDLIGFEYNTATNTWTYLQAPASAPGQTVPRNISGASIVGAFSDTNNDTHGFVYSGTSWATLDDPSCNNPIAGTSATGISGDYVSGYYYANASNFAGHGFLYDLATHAWTNLDAPFAGSGGTTIVYDVSGNYAVGAYSGSSGGGGLLYNITTQAWTELLDPLGNSPTAVGVSGNNVVGVDFEIIGSNRVAEGFVYNIATNNWSFLQDPLADLSASFNGGTGAYAIDGDNIVGDYASPGGPETVNHGFEAVVPEPSSLMLLAIGGLVVGWLAIRRPGVMRADEAAGNCSLRCFS